MALRPLHDRLLVSRLPEDEQTSGGLFIPDAAKEKPQQGTVVSAGAGKSDRDGKRVPLDVQAGDTVLFGRYAGQEVRVDGVDYVIMREDDVLAVIAGAQATA